MNIRDAEGNFPLLSNIVGAVVAAGVEYGAQVAANFISGKKGYEAFTAVDVFDIAVAAGEGFISSGTSIVKNHLAKQAINVGAEILGNTIDLNLTKGSDALDFNSMSQIVVQSGLGLMFGMIENPSFLFIGNSFTWRQGSLEDPAVPRYFKAIANNLGQNLTYDFVVESSYTLTSYADANDRLGSIVDSKIKNNKYDYVILQEQSTRPLTNYQAFEDAVKALKSKIDKYQTKCKTILYETWGSPASMNSYGGSVQEMEARLRTAYEKCAKAANCSVNYIGKAFTYAYVNEGINIYADDNRHQSNEGAYFSAACHVRSIFGLQVSKCTNYCGLNQTECKSLLGIADKII